ncbi:HepT-like ribonuclease domain-containing protein [Brachybacterium subflavum]|uniref:HepT-like ribonuclease domain-containing protein n=1 Tax=Brachybacterium subflavum TaxID=2585206 RepID=UPI0012663E91|nr:HepT-like ribonuclease domain-containing protein [Brachybacterium subflavum]
MRREAAGLLWDAQRAARRVLAFIDDASFEDYERDALLRSAVERQFEILGEALDRLSRSDPAAAETIPDLPQIVAFRNILIHGYATVDSAIVWETATTRLDALLSVLDRLLSDDESEIGHS